MPNGVVGKSWERTNDKVCHRPLFEIRCRYCDEPMLLRFSEIAFDDKIKGSKTCINHICYKCPECAWIVRFDVGDDEDYLFSVLKMRGNAMHFQPDASEWIGESEKMARQLEGLGYFGGRES